MKKLSASLGPFIAGAALVAALAAMVAICLHSLEEIHYLKRFFPRAFTVQEVFYASAVELVKVLILLIPLLTVIGLALYFLRHRGGK
ncbi:hypothetical protein DESUT3_32250 [Desulfuromonas versatilis]|uniref:Uncharacterized protein n=1 Tax=Desulfuromonas versatilis TaxID=2802975 RepID=A0ABN6E1G6_9BACT|nr:hypothetical protein [Desulfuromonas versatilis]BCR06156.1 hypothetical protein DESUT3_32250 [Desulfuromonas versatilis]